MDTHRARKSGAVRRAGVEGTGSYGASLSRYLLTQGIAVFDVNRMDRADRRRRGKSDPLDAQNAARAVLSGRVRARAKAGDGPVQIARMYKLTKVSAVKARTQAINQLKSVLISRCCGPLGLRWVCWLTGSVSSPSRFGMWTSGPARGLSCPAAAGCGGDRSGYGRRFAGHGGGQPGTAGQ
ncbi:transposase [Streptomyces sp. NPDC051738]|uniref:IS110 family transposase n=1 Tax=Streptomyces sp. NPDC051738 TaxID=3365672 RepID=UPI0037D8C487